jgi:transcriptional regulator with XRE-family HTH domain
VVIARERTSSRDLLGFGKRLRELRKARGLTQAELGGDRYTHAYISMIEAGKKQPPPAMLIYLADRLGIEVDELWRGTPFWTDAFAEELVTGSEEAREVLERLLTLLEREGQVSTRALELAHIELARRATDSTKAESHLRAALMLHEKRDGSLVQKARIFVMLGNEIHDRNLEEAADCYREASALLLDQVIKR